MRRELSGPLDDVSPGRMRACRLDRVRRKLANMVFSLESYIDTVGGSEGVKLEDQLLITDDGPELLSRFPFEEALLG